MSVIVNDAFPVIVGGVEFSCWIIRQLKESIVPVYVPQFSQLCCVYIQNVPEYFLFMSCGLIHWKEWNMCHYHYEVYYSQLQQLPAHQG